MRSANRLFLVLILFCTPLAPAVAQDPSAELLTEPAGPLRVTLSLGCAREAGPLQVTVSPASPQTEPPLFDSFTLAATDSSPAEIVSQDLADQMCNALRTQEGFAGEAPGSKKAHVEIGLEYTGRCEGELAERASYYSLAFNLLCTDVSEIHAPSGADPGPAGDGFTSQTLEMEAVKAYSPDGAGMAYERALDPQARHVLRFAAGLREESVTLPAGGSPVRIETELELIPVDVSYGFRLFPPEGPVVPTVYLGAGYAFADVEVPSAEGGAFADLLGADLEALGGRDEDGFTLHAGFSLRFHLGPRHRGGKYLYLGARARWYEVRVAEESDEEIFLGFGLPVCNCRRR